LTEAHECARFKRSRARRWIYGDESGLHLNLVALVSVREKTTFSAFF